MQWNTVMLYNSDSVTEGVKSGPYKQVCRNISQNDIPVLCSDSDTRGTGYGGHRIHLLGDKKMRNEK